MVGWTAATGVGPMAEGGEDEEEEEDFFFVIEPRERRDPSFATFLL